MENIESLLKKNSQMKLTKSSKIFIEKFTKEIIQEILYNLKEKGFVIIK